MDKINSLKQEERIIEQHGADIKAKKDVIMVRSEIVARYRDVSVMIRKAQKILKCLDKIALWPNPLSQVAYIDLLVQSEQQQGRQGFLGRVKVLRDLR